MRIAICTLGCKVNQYESQAMEKLLTEAGAELVDFSESADAYIINTCSVTGESDRKSRQLIRRARTRSPGAVVAVCGCYSQTHSRECQALEADVLYGTNDKHGFVKAVLEAIRQRRQRVCVDDVFHRRSFESLPAGGLLGRTRAMLKVQDGCVNFCTYCIIPYARGPVRSLPLEEAVAQARALAADGYRELVLTGIEISSYGLDRKDGLGLTDLIEALCRAVPQVRIRLGSLEPRTVTEDFCRRLRPLNNLCPHFHLSLQSGSDPVLARMGRKYDTARFYASVELLRQHFPGCGLTTDLIVGFPGETETEFADTLAFLRRCAFSMVHVFPYSRRPGTKAAGMEGQIPRTVKEHRAAEARALARTLQRDFLQSCVGTVQQVMFEQGGTGHAPNYMEVRVRQPIPAGTVCPVRITGVEADVLTGILEY